MLRSLTYLTKQSLASVCRRQIVAGFCSVNSHSNFSSPADVVEETVDLSPHAKFEFSKHFLATDKHMYSTPEGGFVDLRDSDIEKYFPEGLGGDIEDEFAFSQRKALMIREPTKLLCRIIDDYSTMKKGESSANNRKVDPYEKNPVVAVPNLTDRAEWSDATLKVTRYGADLVNAEKVKEGSNVVKIVKQDTTQSAVEICMQALHDGKHPFPSQVLLTGGRGSGKSTCLAQTVMYARQQGWIVVYVPKGWEHVQAGWFVEPLRDGASKAPEHHHIYDNTIMSVELLRGLWKSHAKDLADLPITLIEEKKDWFASYESVQSVFKEGVKRAQGMPGRSKFTFMQFREVIDDEDNYVDQNAMDTPMLKGFDMNSFEVKTLLDLVMLGIAYRDLAGLAFMHLMDELKIVDSRSVLVAVDQYNTWSVPSVYGYEGHVVQGKEICVPHALSAISEKKAETAAWTMKNGLAICATSLKHHEGIKVFKDSISSIPLAVRVPSYSRVEYLSTLMYYTQQKRTMDDMTTNELLTFRTYSGSVPRLVRESSSLFFLPLTISKFPEGDFNPPCDTPEQKARLDELHNIFMSHSQR